MNGSEIKFTNFFQFFPVFGNFYKKSIAKKMEVCYNEFAFVETAR